MKLSKMMVAMVFILAVSGVARGAWADCSADISGNGAVDAADLALLLGAWGSCGAVCPGDLSGDGWVNAADLAALLGAWGECPMICEDEGGTCTPGVFGCVSGTEEHAGLSESCEAAQICCVTVTNACTDAGGVCAVSLFGCQGSTSEDPALSPECAADQICCI